MIYLSQILIYPYTFYEFKPLFGLKLMFTLPLKIHIHVLNIHVLNIHVFSYIIFYAIL